MIASSQLTTVRALAARLRTRIARNSHKSELLDLVDLLDVALAPQEESAPVGAEHVAEAHPPALDASDKPPADQSAGADASHDRAACDVCRASSPELDARERGWR